MPPIYSCGCEVTGPHHCKRNFIRRWLDKRYDDDGYKPSDEAIKAGYHRHTITEDVFLLLLIIACIIPPLYLNFLVEKKTPTPATKQPCTCECK